MNTRIIQAIAAGLLALAAAGSALAFPDKPVRIIVPYPAGGSTDVAARLVAQTLQEVQADYVAWVRLIKEFGVPAKT